MDLQDRLVSLIRELRNSREVPANWAAFRELVAAEEDALVEKLSIRWLRSVCDTFADFGDEKERRDAMAISMFINMVRFAETVGYMRGDVDPERLTKLRSRRLPLYEELTTFHIHKQDVFLNLSKRMARQLRGSGLMEKIWREMLRRLLAGDNVITELRGLSDMPERYFPIDPLDMTDNYGVA